MTNSDFRQWFAQHCSAFTGLAEWFRKMPKTPANERDVNPSQQGILRSWYGVLASTELQDAIAATGLLFRDEQEIFFDRHPAAIRRIANSIAAPRRMRDKVKAWDLPQKTYRCPSCLDSGFRRVVHPKTAKAIEAGETVMPGWFYTITLACPCKIGDERFPDIEREGKRQRYPRYDERQHCLVERSGECAGMQMNEADMRTMLAAWIANRRTSDVDTWEPAAATRYEDIVNGFDKDDQEH